MYKESESNLEEKDFYQRLQAHPLPVVVDFWAPWCMPCRAIEPWISRLQQEYRGRVDVWKMNANEHAELVRALRVYGIPTLIAFYQGREMVRQTGVRSFRSVQRLFDAAVQGEAVEPGGISIFDRFLRVLAAGVLFYLAFIARASRGALLLAGLAGIVLFSAVYDRCPLWRALYPRIKKWLAALPKLG